MQLFADVGGYSFANAAKALFVKFSILDIRDIPKSYAKILEITFIYVTVKLSWGDTC